MHTPSNVKLQECIMNIIITENEEQEGDPGVVILFADDNSIHRILGLPWVRNINLPPGVVPPPVPLQQGKI